MTDNVNHPDHYVGHPSGIECIDVTEHLPFCLGNAVKYLWRHESKGMPITDLRKAAWYLRRELARKALRKETHAIREAWTGRLAVIRTAAEASPDTLRSVLLRLHGWLVKDTDKAWFLERAIECVEAEISRREGES